MVILPDAPPEQPAEAEDCQQGNVVRPGFGLRRNVSRDWSVARMLAGTSNPGGREAAGLDRWTRSCSASSVAPRLSRCIQRPRYVSTSGALTDSSDVAVDPRMPAYRATLPANSERLFPKRLDSQPSAVAFVPDADDASAVADVMVDHSRALRDPQAAS
jgi:hypothetical protein